VNRFVSAFVAILVVTCLSDVSWAGKVGSEFRVNKYKVADQDQTSVAGLDGGGFVVTWASPSPQTTDNVYGQLYTSGGKRVGTREFRVNGKAKHNQNRPSVAGLADGGFVVVFQAQGYKKDRETGVYGRRYDAAGNAVDAKEFRANKTLDGFQDYPAVAGLADGGFVVVWRSADDDKYGIYGQRFDADGNRVGKREFGVNKTTANTQGNPSVAGLEDGGFVVTWQSLAQDGGGWGTYGQRYDAAGKRVGRREFRVNKTTAQNQFNPSVAGLEDGGFAVAWQSAGQDGSSYGVYGKQYNAAGKRVGRKEFKINKYTASVQGVPSVASLSNGGYVVSWESYQQDGDNYGIYGQQYNKKGKRVGDREFMVNSYTTSVQRNSSVAGLSKKNRFVVTWESNGQDGDRYGAYGQRFRP
jgi:methionine-rich copper-binding protein CopC